MKSIVYGEPLWDVFLEEQVIGGAPFNSCLSMTNQASTMASEPMHVPVLLSAFVRNVEICSPTSEDRA